MVTPQIESKHIRI